MELAPRPLRLLPQPEPIEAVAEVPDGPPLRFRWRRALHEVIAAEGPERIEGAWWSEHGGASGKLARDYFRVEDRDGLRFWLFRAGLYRDLRERRATLVPARNVCVRAAAVMRYLEFAVASNFSFLRGASHPEELMVQAHAIGLAGIGLGDRNSVAGVVRAHLAKREQNWRLRYHPGARLVFADGTPDILAYPRDRAGWGRLTRLLTRRQSARRERRVHPASRRSARACVRARAGGDGSVMRRTSTMSFRARVQRANPDPEPRQSYAFRLVTFALRLRRTPRNDILELRTAAPGRVRLAASMLYRGRDRAGLRAHEGAGARKRACR